MRLAQRIGLFVAAVTGSAPTPNLFDERLWSPDGFMGGYGRGRAGAHVNFDSVMQLDVVEACMVALSGPLSTLPLGVFEKQDDDDDNVPAMGQPGGDPIIPPAPAPGAPDQPLPLPAAALRPHANRLDDHPVARVFNRRPNDRQTAQEFRAALVRDLALWRNFYAVITRDDNGDLAALERLDPRNRIEIKRGASGQLIYFFRDPFTQQVVSYAEIDIWHVRLPPHKRDGVEGEPVFVTHRDVFSRALAVKYYGDDFFRNSGASGMLYTHPGIWKTKEDEDKFLERWRRQGVEHNRHGDRIAPPGFDGKKISANNNEAQFIETDSAAALSLCRLWNMPPHRVGILDRATNSNIEMQSLEFVIYCVAPFIVAIEQAIALAFVDPDGDGDFKVEINVNALLRGDFKTRMQGYAWGRQWGWLSVNDIRREENLPGIGPQGDRYLEPVNMKGAGDGGTSTSSGDPMKDGAPDFEPDNKPTDPADGEPDDDDKKDGK